MGAAESREHRLLTLASVGDAAGLRALLKEQRSTRAPLNVDCHLEDGDCALHLAALHRDSAECAELLVEEFGCRVDEKDAHQATALMFAVDARSLAVVRFLCLSTDADVDAADADGRTALHRAAQTTQSAVLELLLRTQPALDAVDLDGNSPIMLALLEQRREARAQVSAASLRRASAGGAADGRPDVRGEERGGTAQKAAPSAASAHGAGDLPPLAESASSSPGREDVLLQLLSAGASLSLENAEGQSGWSLARTVGEEELCVTAIRKRERDRRREVERAMHALVLGHDSGGQRLPLPVLELIGEFDSHQRLPSPRTPAPAAAAAAAAAAATRRRLSRPGEDGDADSAAASSAPSSTAWSLTSLAQQARSGLQRVTVEAAAHRRRSSYLHVLTTEAAATSAERSAARDGRMSPRSGGAGGTEAVENADAEAEADVLQPLEGSPSPDPSPSTSTDEVELTELSPAPRYSSGL